MELLLCQISKLRWKLAVFLRVNGPTIAAFRGALLREPPAPDHKRPQKAGGEGREDDVEASDLRDLLAS